MSTGKNREEKFKLGKRTSGGEYIYDAKVKMSEDFTLQIERLVKEKKVNLELEKALSKVKKVLSKYPPTTREKNLDYYHSMGKTLGFIDKQPFIDFKPYSLYRRIAEETPGIIPSTESKVIQNHIETMHKLGKIDPRLLKKGTWDQWFEILKFSNLYLNRTALNKIFSKTRHGSGKNLREEIKRLTK